MARAAGAARRGRSRRSPGVRIEQRVTPLDRVGCYVPGGRYPLPSSLLMTAIPARVAGVREVIVGLPAARTRRCCARRCEAGVTRLFRIGGAHAIAALAYGTASIPRVDKIVGPGNAYVAAAKALVAADCAIDFFAGPERNRRRLDRRASPMDRRRPDRAGRARSGRARRSCSRRRRRSRASVARARSAAAAGRRARAAGARAQRRHRRDATLDEAIELCERMAPEHVVCDTDAVAARLTRAGTVFVGGYSAQACGDYVDRIESRAADERRGALRGGLSAADFVRVSTVQTLTAAGLERIAPAAVALAEAEGLTGARRVDPTIRLARDRTRQNEAETARTLMSYEYERVVDAQRRGLRLHLNENTAGCSPRVLAALQRPDARRTSRSIPTTTPSISACARCFGRRHRQRAADQRPRRGHPAGGAGERCVARTADGRRSKRSSSSRRSTCTRRAPTRAGGADRRHPARAGLRLPARARAARRSRRDTRVVFLTNPNNPTGLLDPARRARAIAAAAPQALVFLDEAYADFAGETLIDDAAFGRMPNLVVGRTFAKAYGLAGLRVGALVGASGRRSRRCGAPCRPTALNVCAAAALPGGARRPRLLRLVSRSKCASRSALLYDALERLGVTLLAERRQLRARPLRRRPRRAVVDALGRARHLHPRSIARSGLRGLRAHHRRRASSTRAALPRGARGGPVRRARNRPQTPPKRRSS